MGDTESMSAEKREQARVLVAVLKCGPTWDIHQTIADITQLLVEAEQRGVEKERANRIG